ncbi:MAG TPA: hypothetical protein VF648_05830 [Pyrinomonadaceae bacterium]
MSSINRFNSHQARTPIRLKYLMISILLVRFQLASSANFYPTFLPPHRRQNIVSTRIKRELLTDFFEKLQSGSLKMFQLAASATSYPTFSIRNDYERGKVSIRIKRELLSNTYERSPDVLHVVSIRIKRDVLSNH